jgi:hypothetical protein
LKHYNRFQAFCSAVRYDIAVGFGAEGPAPFSRLTKGVGEIISKLRLVKKPMGSLETPTEMNISSQASLDRCLDGKSSIPDLNTISTVAGHAVRPQPDVDSHLFSVEL